VWSVVLASSLSSLLVGTSAFFWGRKYQRSKDSDKWMEESLKLSRHKAMALKRVEEELHALELRRLDFTKSGWADKLKALDLVRRGAH